MKLYDYSGLPIDEAVKKNMWEDWYNDSAAKLTKVWAELVYKTTDDNMRRELFVYIGPGLNLEIRDTGKPGWPSFTYQLRSYDEILAVIADMYDQINYKPLFNLAPIRREQLYKSHGSFKLEHYEKEDLCKKLFWIS